MNKSQNFKVAEKNFIKQSLEKICKKVNKTFIQDTANRECQCDEKSLMVIPSVKVLITRKVSVHKPRCESTIVHRTPYIEPAKPSIIINVRSVIRKPLLVRRFTENIECSNQIRSIRAFCKQGKLIRGSTFSAKRSKKTLNCA